MVIYMVKNCRVILNNELVTVLDFDGKQIQVPSIKRKANYVSVLFKDNKYRVVPDDYVEPLEPVVEQVEPVQEEKPKRKRRKKKKTTDDETINEEGN